MPLGVPLWPDARVDSRPGRMRIPVFLCGLGPGPAPLYRHNSQVSFADETYRLTRRSLFFIFLSVVS